MAHTPDKTKQNVLMTQNACISKILTVDGGIVAGSTFTVAGAFTQAGDMTFSGSVSFADSIDAASDLNTSGCVQIGATGTDIFHILAGSFAASTPVIAASATGYASALVAGLTQNHKIFISPSAMSGSLFIYQVTASPGGGVVVIDLLAAEAVAEDTGAVFSFFAIQEA